MKALVVLGATGSIGTQTLEVARRLEMPVAGLAARSWSPRLIELAEEWPDAEIAVFEPLDRSPAGLANAVSTGPESVESMAALADCVVVNGIVGAAGLAASVAALEAGNRLALANKESLVAGGPVVVAARDRGAGELVPVDSEHSAVWQVLVGEQVSAIKRLVLTASGGPFREAGDRDLVEVTPEEALAHPTWSMGPRITIDSATLMNKAFEVIEAHYLFGLTYDAIDVVVHPQSIVHSLVEFVDGAVLAELGEPDMRVPIQYAITYPERSPAPLAPFDLTVRDLTFEAVDRARFPALDLGYEAGRRGGSAPAMLNAADEVAVAAFLEGAITFPAIVAVAEAVLERLEVRTLTSVADVLDADAEARAGAAEEVSRLSGS